MNIDQTIGELVAEDYRTAAVFKKHNIDFCCQGNRTIEAACQGTDLKPEQLIEELSGIQKQQSTGSPDFGSWPVDLLADYVEKKHHRYVETATAQLKPYLEKICQVHGERHPELIKVKQAFDEGAGELAAHMKKEEFILFPFIRKLEKAKAAGIAPEAPNFGTVENPIQMMMHEHNSEGKRYRQINELTGGYTPPADACNTYRVTLALLKEFEDDLHLHIHLENNILFPKAIEMEKSFKYSRHFEQ